MKQCQVKLLDKECARASKPLIFSTKAEVMHHVQSCRGLIDTANWFKSLTLVTFYIDAILASSRKWKIPQHHKNHNLPRLVQVFQYITNTSEILKALITIIHSKCHSVTSRGWLVLEHTHIECCSCHFLKPHVYSKSMHTIMFYIFILINVKNTFPGDVRPRGNQNCAQDLTITRKQGSLCTWTPR